MTTYMTPLSRFEQNKAWRTWATSLRLNDRHIDNILISDDAPEVVRTTTAGAASVENVVDNVTTVWFQWLSRLQISMKCVCMARFIITQHDWDRIQIRFWTHRNTPYVNLTGELQGIIFEDSGKIDRVITAPRCISPMFYVCRPRQRYIGSRFVYRLLWDSLSLGFAG